MPHKRSDKGDGLVWILKMLTACDSRSLVGFSNLNRAKAVLTQSSSAMKVSRRQMGRPPCVTGHQWWNRSTRNANANKRTIAAKTTIADGLALLLGRKLRGTNASRRISTIGGS